MTNAIPQKTPDQPTQGSKTEESQRKDVSDQASTVQNSNRVKKALSKREIMEQLSRERFPWDE